MAKHVQSVVKTLKLKRNKECTGHVVCPHILVLILEVESMFHKFLLKYVTTDTDFCHNQITYLVVWPYCDMADNILPYFARHSFNTRSSFSWDKIET